MLKKSFACRTALLPCGAVLFTALLTACGGSSTTSPPAAQKTLAAASASGCILPATAAQTIALPTAGGVGGTISIGALPSASATCLTVTLATGADAVAASAGRRTLATTTGPQPLTSVTLTNTYNGNLTWVALTLAVPPLQVVAGTYPATITSTLADGQTITVNITVTVDASGNAVIGSSLSTLATLGAGATGTLSVYPVGTVLTTPSPSPAPSASATPTPSPSPSPTASATPTPTPSPTALPTSTPGPTPSLSPTSSSTASISLSPGTCISAGETGMTINYTASVTGGNLAPGHSYLYGWQPAIAVYANPIITVTPPTQSFQYDYLQLTASPANTASVAVQPYGAPSGGVSGAGETGAVRVYLLETGPPPFFPPTQPVLDANGNDVSAGDNLAIGSYPCSFYGLP